MPKRPGQPIYPSSLQLSDESVAVAPSAVGEMDDQALVSLLNRLPDAVLVLDREWRIAFANEEARRISRLDPADLNSGTHWELYPETVGTTLDLLYHRVMETGTGGHIEYFHAPFDVWLDVHVIAMPDGIALHYRDITDRKRAEQLRDASATKLREQSDLITFVQQASRTAFWNLDLVTGRLTFDVGSFPVFGRPFSQLETVPQFSAIVHPADRERVSANVARAVETGELIINEFRVLDAEGNIIWLEARSQIALVDGKPVRLGGITIDISNRKRSEDALAASEERYRILTELSPQFLWTGSPDGHITYANQGFLDYLGFTMKDIGSDRWLTAFDPADQPDVLKQWAHSVATGEVYDVEARLVDGNTRNSRWWWLRALPLRDEAGTIVNWLGVAVEIHDRKTAADEIHERQLETERQRAELETVYRTAPIGLALFDPVDFRYLRLNDRQAEIVGLQQEQVLGRSLTEIAPIPGLNEMFQQVAAGTPIQNALIEGAVAARPEEHRYFNVNYFPVFNADGTVRAITAASLEITAQKKAELALIQSEKLAAVGRLASSISHEINNPLEAVTNLLYLIANDPSLPGELESFVQTAQSELARVCQIATQTLRFHRQAVRPTEVTAEELVGAVLNLYRGRLINSGISIEATYRTTTPVLCLENDIRQVLNNLIANAIDAMRRGGRLVVRAHDTTGFSPQHPEGRPGVRIVIADTGLGMSPAVLARAFEPFYTTKALNGTGLGLWISKGIIDRHSGAIGVRTSEAPAHHGTVFSLFLPHISEAEIERDTPLRD